MDWGVAEPGRLTQTAAWFLPAPKLRRSQAAYDGCGCSMDSTPFGCVSFVHVQKAARSTEADVLRFSGLRPRMHILEGKFLNVPKPGDCIR